MQDIEYLIECIYDLLTYDIVIWGYNLELWSFVVVDVVFTGLCYVIGKGVVNNE